MKDYSTEQLKNFINTLISHGYISVIEGTYPVLSLNSTSREILVGDKKVEFKEFKSEKKVSENNELFEILKEIRRELASENNVPPYVIFGDAALKEMSVTYPVNKEEMLEISGVGEVKYSKYGKAFEDAIKKFVLENNIHRTKEDNCEEKEEKFEDINFEVTTDNELYERLKELRKKFAHKEQRLPQAILSMNTLKEISGRYPNSLDKLKDISQMGPKRIKAYGEEIIDIVNEYVREKGINPVWKEKKRKKVIIDNEHRDNSQIAIDMLKDKINIHKISEEIEVSIYTILGYVIDYIREFGENIFDINLDEFFNDEEEKLISSACENENYEKINEIKKQLPSYITYESIRAVILKKYFNF